MSKLITAAERIEKARQLMEKARALKPEQEGPFPDFSYTAQIKDLMRQARDLLKFIAYTAGVSAEIKEETKKIQMEIDQTEKELLHP